MGLVDEIPRTRSFRRNLQRARHTLALRAARARLAGRWLCCACWVDVLDARTHAALCCVFSCVREAGRSVAAGPAAEVGQVDHAEEVSLTIAGSQARLG